MLKISEIGLIAQSLLLLIIVIIISISIFRNRVSSLPSPQSLYLMIDQLILIEYLL